ncbi:MAG: cellulase family glycosylhydrolase [Bacteroidales bacterium]|nr:cellulase family glycosylhydrolase [Bacteroidales bacterium]
MFRKLCSSLCILLICYVTGMTQQYPGFRVTGRHLYDRCGERVILRGIANPNIWFEKDGIPRYEEIEKTGANVVRIVWQTNGSSADLDLAISNCRAMKMIPMVELHDATGDWSKLQSCVDYWIRADVAEILRNHEEYLLINIANECGKDVSTTSFRTGYENAVNDMRNAGIHVPLIIDGSNWGQNINILQSEGPYLITADPDHNLMFSVHMWWPPMYGYTENDIADEITESVNMNLPFIVGEFSQMHGGCTDDITPANSIAYKTIIRECQKNQVGYIAWSWFGNCNDLWDMSTEGTFATLYSWGLEVAVTDTNSILNTSVRPYLLVNERCDPTGLKNTPNYLSTIFNLFQNYPNPFSEITTIGYRLNEHTHVILKIYNDKGVEIQTLINANQAAGEHFIAFNATGFASGIYFYSLEVDQFKEFRKMIIIK